MASTFKESLIKTLTHFSNEIESVTLYSNIFKEKHILLVLKDAAPFSIVQKLKKLSFFRKYVCELKVFFYSEFLNALDVFPLEFMHLKEDSGLIMGRDVLEGIVISKDNLRHECEFYLRSNLLSAREHYLKHTLPEREIIKQSFNQLLTVLSAVYTLLEIEWDQTEDLTGLVNALEKAFHIEVSFMKHWVQDSSNIKAKDLGTYLEVLAKLIAKIDAL